MTDNEVGEACIKFGEYLQANGVHVDAHLVMINNGTCIGRGNKDKAQLLVLAAVADMMNYKLVPLT